MNVIHEPYIRFTIGSCYRARGSRFIWNAIVWQFPWIVYISDFVADRQSVQNASRVQFEWIIKTSKMLQAAPCRFQWSEDNKINRTDGPSIGAWPLSWIKAIYSSSSSKKRKKERKRKKEYNWPPMSVFFAIFWPANAPSPYLLLWTQMAFFSRKFKIQWKDIWINTYSHRELSHLQFIILTRVPRFLLACKKKTPSS